MNSRFTERLQPAAPRRMTVAKRIITIVRPALLIAILGASLSGIFAVEQAYAIHDAVAQVQSTPVQVTTGKLAIVRGAGTSLHATPGGAVLIELSLGTPLNVFGRTEDGTWAAVVTDNGDSGWVPTQDLRMIGFDELPVLDERADLAAELSRNVGGGVLQNEPTGTPVATATPEPTLAPTMMPTPEATPEPTAIPQVRQSAMDDDSADLGTLRTGVSQVAVVRSNGAELLTDPDGAAIEALSTGTALTIVERTADSEFLSAITPRGVQGWVANDDVVAFNLDRLPVLGETSMPRLSPDDQPMQKDVDPAAVVEPSQPSVGETVPPTQEPALDSALTAVVNLTDSRLNVRAGPGTDYGIVAKALPEEAFTALARNEDSSWLQLTDGKLGNDIGWVSAEYVDLNGEIGSLPVSEALSTADIITAPVRTSTSGRPASGVASSGLEGNLVVQTTPGGDIYVVDMQTLQPRFLTTGFDPAISPDGTTVAFTRDGGDHGLYLIDIDGSNERLIYSGGEGMRSPEFSPDGRYVAFSRLSGEWKCRDVGFGICLPDNPFLDSFPLVTRPEYGLSRVNTDGGEFQDLPALLSAKSPSWSDSGIAYQSNTGLEITRDEPGATTRLLLSAPYYQDPDWQPGGNRIIFQSREGSHWEIFSVNEDGSNVYALTRPVTTLVDQLPSNLAPAWSPDGQYIIYLSSRGENESEGDWRLWIMNEDGSEKRPLNIDLPLTYTFGAEQVVDWGVKPGM